MGTGVRALQALAVLTGQRTPGFERSTRALRTARAIVTVINEYDIECVGEQFTARRQALLTLVRDLRARGVPLHGVSEPLLKHIEQKYATFDDVRFFILRAIR